MIQPKKIMQQRFLERKSIQQGFKEKTRCVWIMSGIAVAFLIGIVFCYDAPWGSRNFSSHLA